MKVASLEAYGAHPDMLAAWTRQYAEDLLPIQEKAVLEGKVLDGASVVGSGPTGCGKTFIAEMAATHAASRGRRVVYLTPTKALAEALYARFSRTYGPLGLRVEISTQDRRRADRRIARGDFDLAVTVPEKLWALLAAAASLVRSIGAVVVDELQLLGDPERGPRLELLLARFLAEGAAQIVGLSAVLGNGAELAARLGARLVEEHRRPVELRKGVWREGRFSYHEHNSRAEGEEEIAAPDIEGAAALETTVALAVELAQRGEPTLVFLRDRFSSVQAARRAAELGAGEPAQGALTALAELPRTRAARALADLLRCGVAFHNADLHFAERAAVEEAFAAGEILCLFSTTTLAVGVNLPARNVIIEPVKWQAAGQGTPSLAPMSQGEFENMAGRAGRLGFGDPFGRAILLGEAGFDADTLMRRYVLAGPEPVTGQLARLPELERLLLEAALGSVAPPLLSEAPPPTPECRALAQAARLITTSPVDGGIELTGLGRAAAACGLSAPTLMTMTQALDRLDRAPTNLEAVILAALSAEALAVPLPPDRDRKRWMALLEERARSEGTWSEAAREILWSGPLRAGERETAARLALVALEWTRPEPSADLEERAGVHAGRALAVCETLGWLAQCLARLCEELAVEPADVERLAAFGEALGRAVPEDCLPLTRMRLTGLHRDHALALAEKGFRTPEDVLRASDEDLQPLAPQRVRAEIEAFRARGALDETDSKAAPRADPALVVDARRPDIATVHGQQVALRPMEFQLLSILARRPRHCVSFDRLYDALWGSREAVEPQQIYWHRHQLSKKLREAMPVGTGEIIRTVPRRGLMLDLPADQVMAA